MSLFLFTTLTAFTLTKCTILLTKWVDPTTPVLPSKVKALFSGYEQSNNRIWLIGGNDNNFIWYYNLTSNQFIETGTTLPVTFDSNAYGQCSVQYQQSIIYAWNGILQQFLFNTHSLSPLSNSAYPTYVDAPSIATDNQYLYITGGSSYNTDFQIYDLSQHIWIKGGGPTMNDYRYLHASITYDNYLYVFGGSDATSSERIFIGDIPEINSFNWTYIQYSTIYNLHGQRAAVDTVTQQILLIGGQGPLNEPDSSIQFYNPSGNTIQVIAAGNTQALTEARYAPAVSVVNYRLFVFGGGDDSYIQLNSWEYSNALTFSPTNNPTTNPTYVPTNTPTISPTYNPTNNPSIPLTTINSTLKPTEMEYVTTEMFLNGTHTPVNQIIKVALDKSWIGYMVIAG
eukprot:427747_1